MKVADYPAQPEALWDIFYDFTQTPRPSKKEEKISEYIVNLAKSEGLEFVIDGAGNIIIYVPGTEGREEEAPLIIQNHIDMVTDAVAGKVFDFNKDSLTVFVEDGWLTADGTTLGADNGIGCAAALALVKEKNLSHPPLELLFTTDEETGLNGALGLEANNLKAKRMLNLDTEEWGSFYIGCAGGIDYDFNKEYVASSSSFDQFYRLDVSGFIGGHSGLNISEQRGNAIKVLAAILNKVKEFELKEVRFGKAHNIIPRDGFCVFASSLSEKELNDILVKVEEEYKSFLPANDHDFKLEISSAEKGDVLNLFDSQEFLKFMSLFPNGVHAMDLNTGIVGCSNNLAKALLVNGKSYFLTSLRFFDRNEVKSVERHLVSLAELTGFSWSKNSEYPSWKPVSDNPLLDKVVESYEALYKKKPIITAIHAGLECGILKDKIGEMDVCSFGPTIEGAHSPDEKVEIASVGKFWDLLVETLKNI